MSTTLSLETSKRVFEKIGYFETDYFWDVSDCDIPTCNCGRKHTVLVKTSDMLAHAENYPAPCFQEVIRVLPRIGEKAKWRKTMRDEDAQKTAELLEMKWHDLECGKFAQIYMSAPTEPEAMQAVETYLLTLLK